MVAAQTLSFSKRDAVDDVVDQAAVELVPVIETAAAETRQAAAEQARATRRRSFVDVDRGDDRHGRPSFSFQLCDLAGALVDAGQAVFGSDPDLGPVRLDREDVVVGQAVRRGELLPLRYRRRAA